MLTFSLEGKTPGMRQRDRQKMSVTFHGAGMVVPYDKKTQVRGGQRLDEAIHFVMCGI